MLTTKNTKATKTVDCLCGRRGRIPIERATYCRARRARRAWRGRRRWRRVARQVEAQDDVARSVTENRGYLTIQDQAGSDVGGSDQILALDRHPGLRDRPDLRRREVRVLDDRLRRGVGHRKTPVPEIYQHVIVAARQFRFDSDVGSDIALSNTGSTGWSSLLVHTSTLTVTTGTRRAVSLLALVVAVWDTFIFTYRIATARSNV